jgi:hypothetical protein
MKIERNASPQTLKERWESVSGNQSRLDKSRKNYWLLMGLSWACATIIVVLTLCLASTHHMDGFYRMATSGRVVLAMIVVLPVFTLNLIANRRGRLYKRFQEDAAGLAFGLYVGTYVVERHYPDVPIEPSRRQAYKWACKTKLTTLMEWIDDDLVVQAKNVLLWEGHQIQDTVRWEDFRDGVVIMHRALEPFCEQEKPWEEYFDAARSIIATGAKSGN